MGIGCLGRYHGRSSRLRNPHFWIILVLFVVLTLSHYSEILSTVPLIKHISLPTTLGLMRHGFERLLYLLLVLYSAWALGWIGGGAIWLSSGIAMLIRSFFISPYSKDAVVESTASLVISVFAVILVETISRDKEQQRTLKKTLESLKLSRRNYEELFANASDAIWVHNMKGKITLANKATEKLTGYTIQELIGKDVSNFLTPEALTLARRVKDKLLRGEMIEPRYEQRIVRKDGSEAITQLATRLITSNGDPQAFQNMARDITEEIKLRDNLRFYLGECLRSQEEERKRLACELHDDTSQQILFLMHGLDNFTAKSDNFLPRELRSELERLYELSQQTYQGIKRYAQALRPRILDDLGLVPALNWLAQELTDLAGIEVQVKTDLITPLPQETQLVLFRIAQEALNNIYRHSGASEVSITLECQEDGVRMMISDNGSGFEVPKWISDFAARGKLGLTGMMERVQLVGGELEVTSETGEGTKIIIKAPIKLY